MVFLNCHSISSSSSYVDYDHRQNIPASQEASRIMMAIHIFDAVQGKYLK